MDVSEVIQEAYREYETLSRDPDVLPTDVRAAYSTAEQVGPLAATLDMRFVNVLNQVRLRARTRRLRECSATSLYAALWLLHLQANGRWDGRSDEARAP